jgi:recombination protein RecA
MPRTKIYEKDLKTYLSKGLSDKAIAKEMNVTYDGVYAARRRFNLPRNNQLGNTIYLTPKQESIIIGCVLGDGNLQRSSKTANTRFSCEHGKKQIFYAKWKYEQLKSLKSKFTISKRKTADKRNGIFYESGKVETLVNTELNKFYDLFYSSGNKEVSKEILNLLNPLSIAVWFMDDGTLHSGSISIATCSFSNKSINNIIQYFADLNIKFTKHKNKSIYLSRKSLPTFLKIIKPYLLNEMYYKVPVKFRELLENPEEDNQQPSFSVMS